MKAIIFGAPSTSSLAAALSPKPATKNGRIKS
jgi:hypothetical protein